MSEWWRCLCSAPVFLFISLLFRNLLPGSSKPFAISKKSFRLGIEYRFLALLFIPDPGFSYNRRSNSIDNIIIYF